MWAAAGRIENLTHFIRLIFFSLFETELRFLKDTNNDARASLNGRSVLTFRTISIHFSVFYYFMVGSRGVS